MMWLGEGSRMPGSPAWGSCECQHVWIASPPPSTTEGLPAVSCRVGDGWGQEMRAMAMAEALGDSGRD